MATTPRRASIDIGSNTIRVLVAAGEGPGLQRLEVRRRITRLSGGFDGNLSDAAMQRTLEAAGEFAAFAREQGAEQIRIGCTGVVRRAENRDDFLWDLEKVTDVPPVLLSGEVEADLAGRGARHHLGPTTPELVLVDVGGFSTELSIVGEHTSHIASFDLGVVRLTEDLLTGDPPSPEQLAAARRHCDDILGFYFQRPMPRLIAGIAGTPTTIAAVLQGLTVYDPAKVHRFAAGREAMNGLLARLVAMPAADRLTHFPGLEKGREDLLPAGILIIDSAMRLGGYDEFLVSEGGLLDGLLLSEQWPPANNNA